mmetsp:Transcript_17798/g.41292  ORF Transcript_17798/g.41292 Transcript_17798/m.41292 type:complete len:213 (-) Transcript_17798:148-786(-)
MNSKLKHQKSFSNEPAIPDKIRFSSWTNLKSRSNRSTRAMRNILAICTKSSLAECKVRKFSAMLTVMSAMVTSKMMLSNTFHESRKNCHRSASILRKTSHINKSRKKISKMKSTMPVTVQLSTASAWSGCKLASTPIKMALRTMALQNKLFAMLLSTQCMLVPPCAPKIADIPVSKRLSLDLCAPRYLLMPLCRSFTEVRSPFLRSSKRWCT